MASFCHPGLPQRDTSLFLCPGRRYRWYSFFSRLVGSRFSPVCQRGGEALPLYSHMSGMDGFSVARVFTLVSPWYQSREGLDTGGDGDVSVWGRVRGIGALPLCRGRFYTPRNSASDLKHFGDRVSGLFFVQILAQASCSGRQTSRGASDDRLRANHGVDFACCCLCSFPGLCFLFSCPSRVLGDTRGTKCWRTSTLPWLFCMFSFFWRCHHSSSSSRLANPVLFAFLFAVVLLLTGVGGSSLNRHTNGDHAVVYGKEQG